MPVRVSPQDGTERWVNNLGAAGPRITTGVEAVQVSPGRLAAQARSKWVAAMTDPRTHDKWEQRVGSLDVNTWRDLMIKVGIPRIASGARDKQGKYLAFAEKFYPFLHRVVGQVEQMPSTDFASRVQRAVQFMTLVHNYGTSAAG
jgi:hypothetical protein